MIEELKWDTEFFKRKIGRLTGVPPENELKMLLEKACKEGYTYLTYRTVMEKMSDIQILEKYGFYLTDMGIVWERKTDNISQPIISAREATIDDMPVLKSLAGGLFIDSRFYNDPFFSYEEAERFFRMWVENSVLDKANKTFFVEYSGFVICRFLKNEGDILLIGVVKEKQSQGIGHSLIRKALDWFKENGMNVVTVRTQAKNSRAMNFYMGLGFRVRSVDVTLGKILEF
ncbi:MAG: GNAT family N-acetyltransferase [Nitrospirae bacterium]|nr:GNAT family N-acetyltransferase [Nitrospirota bacterium]